MYRCTQNTCNYHIDMGTNECKDAQNYSHIILYNILISKKDYVYLKEDGIIGKKLWQVAVPKSPNEDKVLLNIRILSL